VNLEDIIASGESQLDREQPYVSIHLKKFPTDLYNMILQKEPLFGSVAKATRMITKCGLVNFNEYPVELSKVLLVVHDMYLSYSIFYPPAVSFKLRSVLMTYSFREVRHFRVFWWVGEKIDELCNDLFLSKTDVVVYLAALGMYNSHMFQKYKTYLERYISGYRNYLQEVSSFSRDLASHLVSVYGSHNLLDEFIERLKQHKCNRFLDILRGVMDGSL